MIKRLLMTAMTLLMMVVSVPISVFAEEQLTVGDLNIGDIIVMGEWESGEHGADPSQHSGSVKWEVVAFDHPGYPENSATLWTPYSLQTTAFGSDIDYRNSTVKSLTNELYNTFSDKEKEAVLLTDLPTCVTNTGSVATLQDYVFLLSGVELGGSGSTGGDTGCTNFNFTTEQKNNRAKLSNGNWTSGSYGYL